MVASIRDIESLEQAPLEERLGAATVPALLRRAAAQAQERPALRFLPSGGVEEPELVLSHAALGARIHQAARLFRTLGVGRGDAVALVLPNLPEAYIALLGAMTAGIAMPLNWMLGSAQVEGLLRAARPKVLVALGPVAGFHIREMVEGLSADLLAGMKLLQVGGAVDAQSSWTAFESACAPQLSAALEDDPQCTDVAAYIHTGGTTGQPKLARVVHRSIAYKCWAYAHLLQQHAAHVALGVSPLFHVGGIVLRAIHPLSCGMSIVVPGPMGLRDRDVLQRYWHIVASKRVTELSAVPTSLSVLAQMDPGTADLSSLRPFAITGSSRLPAAVARRLQERVGTRLLCDYGLTEYTATVALPPPNAPVPDGSCGLRLPYTQVRIAHLGADGMPQRDCEFGEIGEILVRGPGLIAGYVDSALNAGLFLPDGWARTGDLGRQDAEGYLWVTGRAKDLIIRGGHNIDPRLIEECLQSHEDVALAAAVGQPDVYAGELPAAYVQLKQGGRATADDLKAFARDTISELAAAPVVVHVLEQLPVTGAGKVDKQLLREWSACDVIARLARAVPGVSRASRVAAAAHPVHGILFTVTLPSCGQQHEDAQLAERVREALSALPCRCELVSGPRPMTSME